MQVTLSEARATLSSLLRRALAGETIVITRSGKPMVRLNPIAGHEILPAQNTKRGRKQ